MKRLKSLVSEGSCWLIATRMKVKVMKEEMEIPKGVEAKLDNRMLEVKGRYGTVSRKFISKKIKITVREKTIEVRAENATKREKGCLYSYAAHIKNMMKGASEGHKYVLKICSGHFPMNISVSGNELVVKNFIGEKTPRKLQLPKNVKVSVEGSLVNVEGTDKELTGQCAASIEQLTRRPGFDKRIFQDGIYIIEKDGKEIR